MSDRQCALNGCRNEQGAGTWANVNISATADMGYRDPDMPSDRQAIITVPVCEDHWHALRALLPTGPRPKKAKVRR